MLNLAFLKCLIVTVTLCCSGVLHSGYDHLQHVSEAESKSSRTAGGEKRGARGPANVTSVAVDLVNELRAGKSDRRSSLCFSCGGSNAALSAEFTDLLPEEKPFALESANPVFVRGFKIFADD